MGHRCFSRLLQERELPIYKKKKIQSLPGRQVIPAENLQPFPADPPFTILGYFYFSPFFIIISLNLRIFVYSIILVIISIIPYFFGYFGLTYLISSIFLGSYYIYLCYDLFSHSDRDKYLARKIFIYSILYLFLIFIIILIDNII